MKNWTWLTLGVFFWCLTCLSCAEDRKDGDWDDNIHLSKKTVQFTKVGGEFTVTAKGSFWLLGTAVSGQNAYDRSVPVESRTSVPYEVAGDWYKISRNQPKELCIRVEPNNSGTDRQFRIELESGDYFDRVTVVQSGK